MLKYFKIYIGGVERMKKNYKHIIFFDTEFISTRRKNQPIEISLIVYDIDGLELKYDKSFSTYILLEKGTYLNKYVTAFTGIDDVVLDKYGIRIKEAKEQFLYFLLNYSPRDTLLAGWSISNDLTMFDILVNKDETTFDLSIFDWYDVSSAFKVYYSKNKNETPSLSNACKMIGMEDLGFHDSLVDAEATKLVMEFLLKEKGKEDIINSNYICKVKKKKVKVG